MSLNPLTCSSGNLGAYGQSESDFIYEKQSAPSTLGTRRLQ